MQDIVIKIFVFFLGSAIGSFLNVCIYRIPLEKSIVKPRSFCPHCKKAIFWYDNIPFVSYLFLRGRCRFCKEKISGRYFLVELITAVLLVTLYNRFGFDVGFLKFAIFSAFLIVTSFIDIEHRIVPWQIPALGVVAGLSFSIWDTVYYLNSSEFPSLDISLASDLPIIKAVVGVWIGYGIIYFLKFIGDLGLYLYLKLSKKESFEGEKESMGLGDVDLMGMIGAFLGWRLTILNFFVAPFLGCLYGVYILIRKKSHAIPYVPFLAGGALIVFFWGEQILRFLFRLQI